MPYIPKNDRDTWSAVLVELDWMIDKHGLSNGELNYLMTTLATKYIKKHGLSYNTGSDVIKALECAKLEFYRKVMAPYEDQKEFNNGTVY